MRCSRELAFCDHTSNRLSTQRAVLCVSNSKIIAQLNASAQLLDCCCLKEAFEWVDEQHCDPSATRIRCLIAIPESASPPSNDVPKVKLSIRRKLGAPLGATMECCIFVRPSRLASGFLSCSCLRCTTYHLWCLRISRLHSGLDFHLLSTLALLMHRNECQQVLGACLRKMGLILSHR